MSVGACQSQRSSRLLDLAGSQDDLPNSHAINMAYAAQVKNNLFPFLSHQAADGLFQLLALLSDLDSSSLR